MSEEVLSEEELEARAKKQRRAKVKIAVGAGLVVLSVGAWLYTRYGVTKQGLGGPCRYAMNCGNDAPTCLRVLADDDGACSRPCDADAGADCAPDVHCVKVGLGEYDDRGVPLEGGYCIPQSLLDARKRAKDGGAREAVAKIDSWLPIPTAPDQLEAEVELRTEKPGGAAGEARSFLVKGTLVRPMPTAAGAKKRTVVDADEMRLFTIDDDKHTFAVTSVRGAPRDVTITKTSRVEKVLGRDCEVWRLDEGASHGAHEACVVLGGAFVDPAAHADWPWMRELAVRRAFPLRVVALDASGRETSHLVATRFDVHATDAAAFAVPKSYSNVAGR